MTGTASSLAALISFVSLAACGAPAEGPAPTAPSSPSAPAPASMAPGASPAPPVAPAASPASTDDKTWPFTPAPSADDLKAQETRFQANWGPHKSNWVPPGKSDKYGHAEGLLDAPYDIVRARLLDFPHYKELAGPKFKKVNVVEKSATTSDLYFQLPIMKGLVTIWYVARFSAARPGMGGAEIIEGKFVKGNIKDMQIVFTIRPGPAKNTILVCDLDLALDVPAPQALLDEELRDACGDAVFAVNTRALQEARR